MPDFDELVGSEPLGGDRERLRQAHELLLQAGAPPELSPQLAHGPRAERSTAGRRRRVKRRAMFLVAAAALIAAFFAAGYAVGHGGGTNAAGALRLKGTAAAPHARATLAIFPAKAGNWPMKLTVTGLPKLSGNATYDVYLVRKGERYLSCGTFAGAGGTKPLTVTLNAPYPLRTGDTWVVTRESAGAGGHGTTVLRPA